MKLTVQRIVTQKLPVLELEAKDQEQAIQKYMEYFTTGKLDGEYETDVKWDTHTIWKPK